MSKIQLPADVAAKYELVNYTGGHRQVWAFGIVDVNALTMAEADALYARKWSKLKLKEAPAAKKAGAPEEK